MRRETCFSSRLKEQNAFRADIQELQNKFKLRRLTFFNVCDQTNLSSVALCMKHLWMQRAKKLAKSVVKKQTTFELDKENDEGSAAVS
jgi:hypothetical protein